MHRKKDFVVQFTSWVGSLPSLVLHTCVFALFFVLSFTGILAWDLMFLILTTIVSLEAIYLAIFIQMTVNRQTEELEEVSEDVEDIQEDIQEISADVDTMQEDVEDIQEDLEGISVEAPAVPHVTLESLTQDLKKLIRDLEEFKKGSS